jgi:hypothetical protein
MAIRKVIENHHVLTRLKQFDTGVRTDITRPASHENHRRSAANGKAAF